MFDLITWPDFLAALILTAKLLLVTVVLGTAIWHVYFKYFDKETVEEEKKVESADVICIQEARKKVANSRF